MKEQRRCKLYHRVILRGKVEGEAEKVGESFLIRMDGWEGSPGPSKGGGNGVMR